MRSSGISRKLVENFLHVNSYVAKIFIEGDRATGV